jgi:hypothetical protein
LKPRLFHDMIRPTAATNSYKNVIISTSPLDLDGAREKKKNTLIINYYNIIYFIIKKYYTIDYRKIVVAKLFMF